MLDNVIDKLLNDQYNGTKSELSKEEVNLIYNSLNSDIYKLLKDRDMFYEDLSKIYKDIEIACKPSEITVDTLVYIGNLDLDKNYPTYNIKYIYGDLYVHDVNMHFENLERVFPIIIFNTNVDNDIVDNFSNLNDTVITISNSGNVKLKIISNGDICDINYDSALNIVSIYGNYIDYIPCDIDNYSSLALAAVRDTGIALKYIPETTDNYKEIAITAIKNDYFSLDYVSTKNKYYFDIATEAIIVSKGHAIDLVPNIYDKILDLSILAIEKSNGSAIKFVVLEDMKDMLRLAKRALELNPENIKYLPDSVRESLKNDRYKIIRK